MMGKQKGVGVAYLRRSTSSQDCSLEDQLKWAIAKADREGYKIDADNDLLKAMLKDADPHRRGLFIDDAISGSEQNRPGLNALLDHLKHQSVQALFTWDTNRLSRFTDTLAAVQLERRILECEVIIFTSTRSRYPNEDRDSQMTGDLASYLANRQAGQYLIDLSSTSTRGHISNAEKGLWNGGEAPYGFVRAEVDQELNIVRILKHTDRVGNKSNSVVAVPGTDPESVEKLETVKLIHSFYGCHGGLTSVAKELNRRGIPSPNAGRIRAGREVSGKWSASTVRSILINPLCKGDLAWGRTKQGKHYRFDPEHPQQMTSVSEGTKKVVIRDKDEWSTFEPHLSYAPVIDPDQWESNYQKLEKRAKKSGQKGVPKSGKRLSASLGTIICGDCGQPMTATTRGETVREPAYVCTTYARATTRSKCNHNWVYRDQVFWMLMESLRRALGTNTKFQNRLRNALREVLRAKSSNSISQAEIDKLMDQRSANQRAIKKTFTRLNDAESDAETEALDELISDYKKKLRNIELELNKVQRTQDIKNLNLEKETKRAMELLTRWRTVVDHGGKKSVSKLVGLLNPEIIIEFDHLEKGRRKNVPRQATVGFNPSAAMIGADIGPHTPHSGQGHAGRPDSMTSVNTLTATPSDGTSRTLTKGNRGDRI